MPQTQPARIYFPTLSLSLHLSNHFYQTSSHPVRLHLRLRVPALFCFACRLGLIWLRVSTHSRMEAEAEAFEGQNLVPITTASLQPLPRSSLLLHISWLRPESPAVVFSYRLISCTALFNVCGSKMQILSSRRQRWGVGELQ